MFGQGIDQDMQGQGAGCQCGIKRHGLQSVQGGLESLVYGGGEKGCQVYIR